MPIKGFHDKYPPLLAAAVGKRTLASQLRRSVEAGKKVDARR
jgi:hypothetical protein